MLHRHALFIVESKSVSEEIRVNERGEWRRIRKGSVEGMASPVEQAIRQATALHTLLKDRAAELSVSRRPDALDNLRIEVLVAISDNGRWEYDSAAPSTPLPVYKADLVTKKIQAEIARHVQGAVKAAKIFGTKDGAYGQFRFHDSTFEAVDQFLRPMTAAESPIAPATSRAIAARPIAARPVTASTPDQEPPNVKSFECKAAKEPSALQLGGNTARTSNARDVKPTMRLRVFVDTAARKRRQR